MILAIDQGTTGTTCMVFSDDGKVAGRAYREFQQHFPRPGWVEHDAGEIWDVTETVAKEAIADARVEARDLAAIGITNQRETVVAWDKDTGEPLANAIVWQDRRTADRCKQLKDEGREELVRERTGLVLDPYFSGTKIEWLIKEGGVDAAKAAFGTIDAWLIHKLCDGRFATDYTNASRTLLFDIGKLQWSEELCEMLSVDPASLPEPCPSAYEFGETTVFGGSIPVAGVAGDQQAALYGQACQEAGLGKNTYGTGSFVLENAGGERPAPAEGLLTTVAWGIHDRVDYALEAAIFVTGAAVQWLRDGLGLIATADETEGLARSLDSNDGVYFVPALTGLGSPHWDPYARGTIVGLTRGTTKAHLARAALEAMAYQTVDAIRAMEESSGVKLEELRADGGATANGWMLQFQADLLGVPVVVPEISETTALGAAFLAGVARGTWSEDDVRSMWTEAARFEPSMGDDQREELMNGWQRAIETTRNHSR
ncbi:MAG TPA: glycerol kinase GlpK [Thermoleophilaceae bacterium]|nr:glycerol kinase GlpK [Thermoleophilaceae bacterium]